MNVSLKKFGVKIKQFFWVAMLLPFTFCIFGPVEMYIANTTEFWFGLDAILPCITLTFLIVLIICIFPGIFINSPKIKYFYAFLFGIGLAVYLQGNFMNINMGVLDGKAINWAEDWIWGLANTLIWLACILAPILLTKFKEVVCFKAISLISFVLISMQIVTLTTIVFTTDLVKDKQVVLTEVGINELSQNKNFLVFILDSFGADIVNVLLSEDPMLFEQFEGFTYYENTMGGYPTTKASLPLILTGEWFRNDKPYHEFITDAYNNTELYDVLESENYDISIFTNPMFVSANAEKQIENVEVNEYIPTSKLYLGALYYKLVSYRYAPFIMKPTFWMYSGDFDKYRTTKTAGQPSQSPYLMDDLALHESTSSMMFDRTNNAMRVYHMNGAHAPFKYDRNLNMPVGGSTGYEQGLGAVNIVKSVINQLKDNNAYNNTAIIVMADHGVSNPQNPMLMIKNFGDTGDFKKSEAPISYDDLQNTYLYIVTGNEDYSPNIFNWNESDERERFFYFYSWDDDWNSNYMPDMLEMVSHVHAREYGGMEKTGLVYASNGVRDAFSTPYEFGDEIMFCDDGNAPHFVNYGFSRSEDYFTWAVGKQSKLTIKLADSPKSDMELIIQIAGAFKGRQRVGITVNQHPIEERTITDEGIYRFKIPKELVADEKVTIIMDFPDAQETATSDARNVSVAFEKIILEEQ